MDKLAEDAARLFGVTLTPAHEAAFARYADELTTWNAHTNLTAITDAEGVRVRHFLDSLSVAHAVPLTAGMRVIDVGTGAGFPGVPLALLHPDIHVTLLEATGKKIAFLAHLISVLGLRNATALHARAEDAGQMRDQRARYDIAVARAVARLPVLLEYLLPLVKVGGRALAMKGGTAHAEAADSRRALATLGGTLDAIHRIDLPGVTDAHHLVVVNKHAPTPEVYPRKPGVPAKQPL
ncbi:MAG: 16S rRNA (guanine(527)-N(7))-methyltransferase RsmG [Chloroflexota bacterium]|nr:16S rRNA (guanine(527)-N(7))-methyltransferase RsmG [Chloroflexota bacterium]